MKISRDVSYHLLDDKVYVSTAQRDYIMSRIVAEILDYVAKNRPRSVPVMLRGFSAQYAARDVEKVQSDVGNCVDELLGEEILTEVDEA